MASAASGSLSSCPTSAATAAGRAMLWSLSGTTPASAIRLTMQAEGTRVTRCAIAKLMRFTLCVTTRGTPSRAASTVAVPGALIRHVERAIPSCVRPRTARTYSGSSGVSDESVGARSKRICSRGMAWCRSFAVSSTQGRFPAISLRRLPGSSPSSGRPRSMPSSCATRSGCSARRTAAMRSTSG